MPIYNSEKYICQCLDSIINQTLTDIEIILINDGSTDESLEILKTYVNKDKRIKLFTQENKGVSEARNRGIKESSGEYIGFVDIDDFIDVKMYESLYYNAKNNNSDMHICAFNEILDKKVNIIDKPLGLFQILRGSNIRRNYVDLIINNEDLALLPVWNKIYNANFIKENKIYFDTNRVVAEDRFFNINVMLKANIISSQNDKLYNYNRNNEMSATNRYNDKMIERYLEEKRDILDFIIKSECTMARLNKFKSQHYTKIFYQLLYYSMIEIKNGSISLTKLNRLKDILNKKEFIESLNFIKNESRSISILITVIKLNLYGFVYILLYLKSKEI